MRELLAKPVVFAERSVVLACDGRCDLAWGMDRRPRRLLMPGDPDDYCFLGDREPDLGSPPSPPDLGSEGGHFKPSAVAMSSSDSHKMNRWCTRQCERAVTVEIVLPDLVRPRPNKLGPY